MKFLFYLLFSLFAACYACGQIDTLYGKKMVQMLASNRMNGRGYVKHGDLKAAKFIAKQFKKMHLSALSGGNNYFQTYTMPVNYFPGKMFIKIDNRILQPGIDYLIGASAPTIKGKYDIVKIPRSALLDSAQLFTILDSANGKFLLFNADKDSLETADESNAIRQNLEYLYNNPDLKIAGILLASMKKLTWTVWPFQSPKPCIDIHSSYASFQPKNIELNIESSLDTAYQTQNVCAYIKGTQFPDSFLVISAHYDHLGRMGKKTLFPGANDNASGTAFMLTLAKYFAQHPSKYSIAFLAFSGEEIGLKGSEYFTQNPLIPLSKIKFLTNFDMAGTGIDGIQVVNATVFPQQFNTLVALNQKDHLLKDIKPRGETKNSDHYWFYKFGVPSFFIYTLGGINYHDINDTYASLPFDAFNNYLILMRNFIDTF